LIIVFSLEVVATGLLTGYIFYTSLVCVGATGLLSTCLTGLVVSTGLLGCGAVYFGAISVGTYLAFFFGPIYVIKYKRDINFTYL
jgi:hypothetical protein